MHIVAYVISFNRLTVLKRTLNDIKKLIGFENIVLFDMGSDYEPLLNYYCDIEKKGVEIVKLEKISHANELNKISPLINKINVNKRVDYYIVTDPDVSISISEKDILSTYIALLENNEDIDIVGPMLRITDLPKEYPLFEFAMKRHVDQFWKNIPERVTVKDKSIYVQRTVIDTTFGMMRAGTKYQRLLSGFRTYYPYEAKHLDWYLKKGKLKEDQLHYLNSTSNDISHWQGSSFINPPIDKLSKEERIIYVVKRNKVFKHMLPSLSETFSDKFLRILKNFTSSSLAPNE